MLELIEKRKRQGYLEGNEALTFLRLLRSAGQGSSTQWTEETFTELTKWQLGMKTRPGFNFKIIAPVQDNR